MQQVIAYVQPKYVQVRARAYHVLAVLPQLDSLDCLIDQGQVILVIQHIHLQGFFHLHSEGALSFWMQSRSL